MTRSAFPRYVESNFDLGLAHTIQKCMKTQTNSAQNGSSATEKSTSLAPRIPPHSRLDLVGGVLTSHLHGTRSLQFNNCISLFIDSALDDTSGARRCS